MRKSWFSGAFRERLHSAWTEIQENLGRSTLQTLGVVLGVASVLGGFSITDSFRRQSMKRYVMMGGLDKLNVQPSATTREGSPTALQMANLGLRTADAQEGGDLETEGVHGISIVRQTRVRVRSPFADQERSITGIGVDSPGIDGFTLAEGRMLSTEDMVSATPVAVLGSEATQAFFPNGHAVGQTLTLGDIPVKVVGVYNERVFRFNAGGHNIFRRQNRAISVPATFIQRRLQGDAHQRLDRIVFRIPDLKVMARFTESLSGMLKANHRQQEDFRLDDVAKRVRRQQSNGDAYNIIFMLSGILALVGGGIVNVNIQLASLRERVREVGVKMAIGASGTEIFKAFMTEALLLTTLGSLAGLGTGVLFSWVITRNLEVPLFLTPGSFVSAFILAGVTGFLFALYPAWKAARQSPMEALRYE